MRLIDHSVHDLLARFRSPDPTPGGGSASALAGAIGASLLAMVAALPKSKAATEEDVERLSSAGVRCAHLSDQLAAFVDRDTDAYALVVAAYRLPKHTDDEKSVRTIHIQEALRQATDVPLEVMRTCMEAIEQGEVVAQFGTPNASSDVQVAMELLGAGLRGARLNVEINLGSVKDADYAGRVREDVARLTREAQRGITAAHDRLNRPA
jgi:formiminotetrahydrofolate cyclodeaminase